MSSPWWECKIVQPLQKTVWRFLPKLKIELLYDSTVSLLGMYSKETMPASQRDIWALMFMAILFYKTQKEPKCSSLDEWTKKSGLYTKSFPDGSVGKDQQVQSWVRKIPRRRKWQCTPVFLPGKSHGQRSLVGYSPWGCKESATTEHAAHIHNRILFCL